MTTANEIRELDDDELENRLINARKELFNLRFQAATGRLDNSARVGEVRREIARLLTVLRQREAGISVAAAVGTAQRGGRRRRRDEED
ncbi:MAG: 50S ribosomal protein L29 [Acidimicrobiales bacterium]|jgi:large subunit ribosomal protein L29